MCLIVRTPACHAVAFDQLSPAQVAALAPLVAVNSHSGVLRPLLFCHPVTRRLSVLANFFQLGGVLGAGDDAEGAGESAPRLLGACVVLLAGVGAVGGVGHRSRSWHPLGGCCWQGCASSSP
eukprot:COSAG01_NODE_179_length_22923_cov_25.190535_29_plen_122_part_00